MQRVAIFGNAGGGKSTLAFKLAAITGLPLHVIDLIEFHPGGGRVPIDQYLKLHDDLITTSRWIIDGYGGKANAWKRFEQADTLVHVDLPLRTHYWWVTKRFIKGLFKNPRGWPEKSPLWESTLSSYRVIRLCDEKLTPEYRKLMISYQGSKRTFHLTTPRDIEVFLEEMKASRRQQPLP